MNADRHLNKIIDVNYDFADLHPIAQYEQFHELQGAKRAMRSAFLHRRIIALADDRIRSGLTLLTKPVGALS